MASPIIQAHWYRLFDQLETSPLAFYDAVTAALEARQLPHAEPSRIDWREGGVLSAEREYLRIRRGRLVFDICGAPYGTGFFVSWWLGRLRSSYGPLALLLLVVGFFILGGLLTVLFGRFLGILALPLAAPLLLWVLARTVMTEEEGRDAALKAMPVLGGLYERWFSPETYYRIDTELIMFQTSVHRAVLEVLDELTKEAGIAPLSDVERKPILRDAFRS